MDIPGEKLVIKLWETLTEKGIGSLLTPWQIVREGRARNEVRRQELLMLAQVERDVADVRAGRARLEQDGSVSRIAGSAPTLELALVETRGSNGSMLELGPISGSAAASDAANAARSEVNASKAVIFAEEQLAGDSQSPPSRPIDDDWLFTWREYAGKVSAEDLQRLWGSVLAGEVKSPGSFSIRTLEFLRGLSKAEAEIISKLASVVVEGHIVRSAQQHLDAIGISFSLLLKMQELGVISGVAAIGLQNESKSTVPDRFVFALRSNGKVLVIPLCQTSCRL